MKVYSRKLKRNIERAVHFGIGKSTKSACGVTLFSRKIMVSVFSDWDGSLITDDISRVTCKRCLAVREVKIRKLIKIESLMPGIFDRETLCGEEWLLKHSLDLSRNVIDSGILEVESGERKITLSNSMKSKDRKFLLKNI